ncbi:hypothetical protein OIU77_029269 [Salix suchowensis]|uniref:DUF659 domain-containing protein n=1 Tax=Salix suchowensis TaxID=1278906 RepID=A0ABQ9BP69_9ROSI|nr:hypothetical protein OIU78_008922 [Salix suchowensis]KAJ6386264.1 hypothetical protein OIU77_029269 [Salix suchowensis]
MTRSSGGVASVSIHEYGVSLDDRKRRVQCKFCDKVVGGFYRLKFHIGGVRGDVAPCEAAPLNVRDQFRRQILEAKDKSLAQEFDHPRNDQSAAAWTGGLLVEGEAAESETSVSKEVAEYLLETGINVRLSDSPPFQGIFGGTVSDELEVEVVEERIKDVQEKVEKIRKTWASSGCTILMDEWVDGNDRCLVNFLVDCPDGLVYLRSADITDVAGDTVALQNLLEGVIEEAGQQNVVQVMTCSVTSWMFPVIKQIRRSHMHIFWAVSASDCMGLMLEKIAAVNDIRRVLDEATSLVRFVHNNAAVLEMFRDFTGSERENLFKPAKMRPAIPFLILESILSCKDELKEMFTSLDWKSCSWSKTVEGKKAAGLVKSSSFWKRAGMASKATTALIRVADKISSGNKPSIGFIYETMDQIKEAIEHEFRNSNSRYMPLWELIDEIWNDFLHSPLHAAAYYLNPTFFYDRNFHLDTEVSSGFQCSVIRMENDQRVQYLINKQATQYCRADGDFENGYAEDEIKNAHPGKVSSFKILGKLFLAFIIWSRYHVIEQGYIKLVFYVTSMADLWWSVYGNRCPELQKLAIRILSQTCDGSGRFSLDRSLAEKMVCKDLNQPEQNRRRDQMFVRYNLQLEEANKNKRKAGGGIDVGAPPGSRSN